MGNSVGSPAALCCGGTQRPGGKGVDIKQAVSHSSERLQVAVKPSWSDHWSVVVAVRITISDGQLVAKTYEPVSVDDGSNFGTVKHVEGDMTCEIRDAKSSEVLARGTKRRSGTNLGTNLGALAIATTATTVDGGGPGCPGYRGCPLLVYSKCCMIRVVLPNKSRILPLVLVHNAFRCPSTI